MADTTLPNNLKIWQKGSKTIANAWHKETKNC